MNNCNIVRDLLPLYVDKLTGESSNEFIQKHIEICVECQILLERMCKPIGESNIIENTNYKKALQQKKRKITRKNLVITVVALLIGIIFCITILWSRGYFYIVEKQISPDGTNKAIAYSKNVSGIFPNSGFTIKHTGSYESTMSYSYASFDSMNWSADSKYLVVSMVEEDNTYLKVFDYLYHTEVNLNWYLDRAIYQSTGLFEFPYDEDANSKIKYRFLQWSEYKNTMLLYFTFLDKKGIERSGYFWYDYENGSISGVSELFVQETTNENLWKKQLQIILDYSSIWFISKYEDSVHHQYAVTDLDQNGRLEVITSYILGSGHYAESYYYEVNEALNGLIICEQKDRRPDSEADIIIDNAPIYYDSEHNIYYYIFDETRRDGIKCSYENRHALSFKDGVLSDRILAYKTVLHKDSSTVITCSNADRNTISENEYDNIADTIFPDFIKMEASFSWFEPYSSNLDSNNIEEDTLMDMLLKSYQGFQIQ